MYFLIFFLNLAISFSLVLTLEGRQIGLTDDHVGPTLTFPP